MCAHVCAFACAHVCVFVYHSNDIHNARSSCRSVGLGICVIEHCSIESSVVDGSTIRVG